MVAFMEFPPVWVILALARSECQDSKKFAVWLLFRAITVVNR